MSHRRFTDGDGRRWEIRIQAKGDWRFVPVGGNSSPPRVGEPPLHATDPFEVSEVELRRVLDGAAAEEPRGTSDAGRRPRGGLFGEPPASSGRRSPFRDDAPGEGSQPPFPDGAPQEQPKRSPFLDDREED